MNYKTDEIDFSPFNADEVLRALCSVLRTSKHLSFSYAGDIQSLIDRIGRVFYAGRALIFVHSSDERPQVEIFEYVKSEKAALAFQFATPFGQRFAAHLVGLAQEVTMVEEPSTFAAELDSEYKEFFGKLAENLGPERFYMIPLRLLSSDVGSTTSEKRAGLLLLQESDAKVRWNKLVLDSLVTIADHLAKLAQVESLNCRLEAHEKDDAATGFLNRRGGVVALTEEIERAKFFGDELCLMLVVVDSLRRSDATMTAAQSKELLAAVSSVVSKFARPVDVICRYGHDQFLLSLPRMAVSEAEKVAEHIKSGINGALLTVASKQKQANHGKPFDEAQAGVAGQPLSASIGVACMSEDGKCFDELLAVCHDLVSQAQSIGGNVVKVRKKS
ncbi:MAG: diguanylate cyclase [Candidatus Obscuribacter sp.]|nr:diguanylate cyclase [Candidatus Obscuribacter sp.]